MNASLKPAGGKTGILQEFYINTMATDDLVPCVARAPATMVLSVQDKRVLAFHEEGFRLPARHIKFEQR